MAQFDIGIGDLFWNAVDSYFEKINAWERDVASSYEPKEYGYESFWEFHVGTAGLFVIAFLCASSTCLVALMLVNDVGLIDSLASLLFGGLITNESMDPPTLRVYSEANNWLLTSFACLLIAIGLRFTPSTVCEVLECQFATAWRQTGLGILLVRFLLISLLLLRYTVDSGLLPCDFSQSPEAVVLGADNILYAVGSLNMAIWSRLLFPLPFSIVLVLVETVVWVIRKTQCSESISDFLNTYLLDVAGLRYILVACVLEFTVVSIFDEENKRRDADIQRKHAAAMLLSKTRAPLNSIVGCLDRVRSLQPADATSSVLARQVSIIQLISDCMCLKLSLDDKNFSVNPDCRFRFRDNVGKAVGIYGSSLKWGRRQLKLEYSESCRDGGPGPEACLFDVHLTKVVLHCLVCYATQVIHRHCSGSDGTGAVDHTPILTFSVEIIPSDSNFTTESQCWVSMSFSFVADRECVVDAVFSETGHAISFGGTFLAPCSDLATACGGKFALTVEPMGENSPSGRCYVGITLPCARRNIVPVSKVASDFDESGGTQSKKNTAKSGVSAGKSSAPRSSKSAPVVPMNSMASAVATGGIEKVTDDIDLLVMHVRVFAGLIVDEDDNDESAHLFRDVISSLRTLNVDCVQLDIDDREVTNKATQLLFVLCGSLADCIRMRNKGFKGHIAYMSADGVYSNMDAMAHCDTILPVPCTLSELSALKFKLIRAVEGVSSVVDVAATGPHTGAHRETAESESATAPRPFHWSIGAGFPSALFELLTRVGETSRRFYYWWATLKRVTGGRLRKSDTPRTTWGLPVFESGIEEDFVSWYVTHPVLPAWVRAKWFGEVSSGDRFRNCRNIMMVKWLLMWSALTRFYVFVRLLADLAPGSRGIFNAVRFAVFIVLLLAWLHPNWCLDSLKRVIPSATPRWMWSLCGIIVMLFRIGFLLVVCTNCNEFPCTANEIKNNFEEMWHFDDKSAADTSTSASVVLYLALIRGSYIADAQCLFLFPWPIPLINALLFMVCPFGIMYGVSSELDGGSREANSLLVLITGQFVVYIITVCFIEYLLRKQFILMIEFARTEKVLREHHRRFSTDFVGAIRDLGGSATFLSSIRSQLLSESLQLSDTLLRDAISFHVGFVLLKIMESDITMQAGSELLVLPGTNSPFSEDESGVAIPAERSQPVLKDSVRLASFVRKLASAFGNICGTPIEVFVVVDPALHVVRTDKLVLQNLLYLAISAAENNIHRLVRCSEASRDEIHEILIRVCAEPATTAVKAFTKKRVLTIEVIDSGFRTHRPPSVSVPKSWKSGAPSAGVSASESNICVAEHLCRNMLDRFGLKYQLSDMLHYKYANKQELTMYYLPHPKVGPLGGTKTRMVRAVDDHAHILRSFSHGRLVLKKALVVEDNIGVTSKTSSNSSSGSHISSSTLQRSGWECTVVSDPASLHLSEGLQLCTVVIVDSLVFSTQTSVSPRSLVASLRSAGFRLAVVCLLQHSLESLDEVDCFDGTITKPLHSCTDELLDIASISFLNVALWINDYE